ncbi:ctd small phosphatase-like protein 2-like [Stylonychia lemnae]|uniref:Ctd small phosphatase-like protein 2-like n=1 Tax=Stylonychia lemnae TaxID=5949 RepID=A0A078A217_STYLE|nr:ctd small phosphatase-like protein 2-like [Stylonychia lemnae]|eukprot:CDW76276.1 ctd small phosphatase-like protein 2-like [Stylonychia lemnae]
MKHIQNKKLSTSYQTLFKLEKDYSRCNHQPLSAYLPRNQNNRLTAHSHQKINRERQHLDIQFEQQEQPKAQFAECGDMTFSETYDNYIQKCHSNESQEGNTSEAAANSEGFSTPQQNSEKNIDLKTDSTSVDLHFNEQSILSENSNQDMDIAMSDSDLKDDSPQSIQEDAPIENLIKPNDQQQQKYIQNLILQTIQQNIETVRRLPPYSEIINRQNVQPLLPSLENQVIKIKFMSIQNQKTLVLDMDETLVHCSFEAFYGFNEIIPVSHNFSSNEGSPKSLQLFVAYRPYLLEFIQQMSAQNLMLILFLIKQTLKINFSNTDSIAILVSS